MLANNGLEEDTTVPEDTQTQLVVIGGGRGGHDDRHCMPRSWAWTLSC